MDAKEALRRVNVYNLSFKLLDRVMNGSLFNDPYSIYRADPSPSVDAAWDRIAYSPIHAISHTDILAMGKDPAYSVRFPEHWGYGTDKYMGIINGQHLLHCVNMLRKYAHYDYYFLDQWGPMSKMPPKHAAHRSHCIGAIADALRCQMSVEMHTYVWMEGQEQAPFPDFNVKRKCMDHEVLLDWQNRTAVPWKLGNDLAFEAPADATWVEGYWQTKALKGWVPNGSFPQ
ncbi:hypothetical protein N0V90_005172 [Kalmusia sp. IMI 367209]|nr:hypothetical protein N0V90_005172 [Kalmusia sp. IMI 367209]